MISIILIIGFGAVVITMIVYIMGKIIKGNKAIDEIFQKALKKRKNEEPKEKNI